MTDTRRHSKSYLVRLTPDEFRMLTELVEHLHINRLSLLRSLIAREHRAVIGDSPRQEIPEASDGVRL